MLADPFQALLVRVGQLNYTWTNTESLLIHLIAGLAGVDKETAVVIFLTLNTTRARLDLVERLAKLPRTPSDQAEDVLGVTADMGRESALRNKYNHCIYSFDEAGSVNTILMRISDRKREIRYGKTEAVDARELASIDASIARLQAVNVAIWRLIRKHGYPA